MSSSTSCLYGTIYSYSPPTRTQLLPTNMSPRSLIGLFQTGGLSTTHGATYPLWKDIVKDLQPDIKYTGTVGSLGEGLGAGSSAMGSSLELNGRLSLFHLEVLLWLPVALSWQCRLLQRLGWSAVIARCTAVSWQCAQHRAR